MCVLFSVGIASSTLASNHQDTSSLAQHKPSSIAVHHVDIVIGSPTQAVSSAATHTCVLWSQTVSQLQPHGRWHNTPRFIITDTILSWCSARNVTTVSTLPTPNTKVPPRWQPLHNFNCSCKAVTPVHHPPKVPYVQHHLVDHKAQPSVATSPCGIRLSVDDNSDRTAKGVTKPCTPYTVFVSCGSMCARIDSPTLLRSTCL